MSYGEETTCMPFDSVSRPLKRRAVLRLLGLSGGAALIAACGQAVAPAAPTSAPAPTAAKPAATSAGTSAGTPPAPGATLAATSQPAAAQPKSGGTLRWGLLGNIVTLDGHNYARSEEHTSELQSHVN